MITVKLTYTNGTTDIRDVLSLDDIVLDGVLTIKVLRDERVTRSRAA